MIFGLVICFDIWFPEIAREYVSLGVDVLLHPANFGGEQSLIIARTRAVENNMFVVTCNRVGVENAAGISGTYCGHSQVVDPDGNLIYQAGDKAEIQTVMLNIEEDRNKKVIGVTLAQEICSVRGALNLS